MNSLYQLALRNLGQSRARTVLMVLAVSIGVAIISATGVFSSGVRATWESGESKAAFISEVSGLAFKVTGGLLLAASGFLIYNAFAMTVTQRQQQIGMLRALGMSRRQVLNLVLVEALATGGMGTLLGLLFGPLLGSLILAFVRAYGMDVGRGVVQVWDVVLGVSMGLGITLLAALPPARRAARLSPMVALSEIYGDRSGYPGHKRPFILQPAIWGSGMILALWLWLLIAPPGRWSGYHTPWDYALILGGWGIWAAGVLLVSPALIRRELPMIRRQLDRLGGTLGRLVGDNLERNPGRVSITAATFTIGLMLVLGINGQIYYIDHILVRTLNETARREAGIYVSPADPLSGLGQVNSFAADAPGLDPALLSEIEALARGRAEIGVQYMVSVPEISAPMAGFPSYIVSEKDVDTFRYTFTLSEGDWDVILPRLKQAGCAVFVTPPVAVRNHVKAGERFTVTGLSGPVECLVAGLGAGGATPFSVIGPGGRDLFVPAGRPPDRLIVRPLEGVDRAGLEAELRVLAGHYPGEAYIFSADDGFTGIIRTADQLMGAFNGMLFLGLLGAALGMINTILVSVLERQRELGLLRAVGATRRQIIAVVVGESTLVGGLGMLLGMIGGLGLAAIVPLTYGAVSFGLTDFNLRWAAVRVLLPTLGLCWWALVSAPLLAALAAWPIARSIISGPTIETLDPDRRSAVSTRRAVVGLLSRRAAKSDLSLH